MIRNGLITNNKNMHNYKHFPKSGYTHVKDGKNVQAFAMYVIPKIEKINE